MCIFSNLYSTPKARKGSARFLWYVMGLGCIFVGPLPSAGPRDSLANSTVVPSPHTSFFPSGFRLPIWRPRSRDPQGPNPPPRLGCAYAGRDQFGEGRSPMAEPTLLAPATLDPEVPPSLETTSPLRTSIWIISSRRSSRHSRPRLPRSGLWRGIILFACGDSTLTNAWS